MLYKCLWNESLTESFQAIITDHSYGVEAIRTAGSTADWRRAALLIELEAQISELVTL